MHLLYFIHRDVLIDVWSDVCFIRIAGSLLIALIYELRVYLWAALMWGGIQIKVAFTILLGCLGYLFLNGPIYVFANLYNTVGFFDVLF